MANIVRIGGGGGASLNYDVVAVASESNPPASPSENTIGVITTTAIGYHTVSQIEPTARVDGKALQSGDVWISTDSSAAASFAAIEDGTIVICPYRVKQYIGGTWTAKAAYIYQNGTWVQISSEAVTVIPNLAGFPAANWSMRSYSITTEGYISIPSKYNASFAQYQSLDLSGYSAIEMVAHATNSKAITLDLSVGTVLMDTSSSVSLSSSQKKATVEVTLPADGTEQTVQLDISSVDSGYLSIEGYASGATALITSLRLLV